MGSTRPALLLLIAAQLFTLIAPAGAASVASHNEHERNGIIGSASSASLMQRADPLGYTNPAAGGGYMLTVRTLSFLTGANAKWSDCQWDVSRWFGRTLERDPLCQLRSRSLGQVDREGWILELHAVSYDDHHT
jgi:hypothetical protein